MVVGEGIRGVAAKDPGHDRHRRVSVGVFEWQVLAMGQREWEGNHEDQDERGHSTEGGDEEGPAFAQPARKYATRGRTDARA